MWSAYSVLGFDPWAVLFRFCYYFLFVVLNVVFFGQSLMRTKCFCFFIFVSNLVPTPKIFLPSAFCAAAKKAPRVGLMTESVAMDMEGPIGAEEAIEDHDGTAADLDLWCQQGEIPSLKNYCPARKGLKRYSIWNVQV